MNKSAICVLAAVVPVAAFGQATPISQARALAFSGPSQATDFGPWTNSASSSNPQTGSFWSASQTSDLNAGGATFSLTTSCSATFLDYVFSVSGDTPFTLSGQTTFNQGPPFGVSGVGTMTLTGPGVNIAAPNWGIWTTIPWSFSGVLSAGTYTLHVTAAGSGSFQQSAWRAGGSTVNGALVLTPTPGSTGVLLVGAAGLLRRRR